MEGFNACCLASPSCLALSPCIMFSHSLLSRKPGAGLNGMRFFPPACLSLACCIDALLSLSLLLGLRKVKSPLVSPGLTGRVGAVGASLYGVGVSFPRPVTRLSQSPGAFSKSSSGIALKR